MSKQEWRETVKGQYWKNQDYRIEYPVSLQYQAGYFEDKRGWTDYKIIGSFGTLEEAKAACEAHSRILPFGGQYKGNDGRPVGGHAPIA